MPSFMTRGILAPDLSSRCNGLRILATPSDKPARPFKPRVVGSIPTRLTPSNPFTYFAALSIAASTFALGSLRCSSQRNRKRGPFERFLHPG